MTARETGYVDQGQHTDCAAFYKTMDLLISHQWGRFRPARREVMEVLRRLGDDQATMEWTVVNGISVLHTSLDGREVIAECRKLLRESEMAFEFAVKWVPVDYWCDTDIDAMKTLIENQVVGCIGPGESWAMKVHKRRWQTYHTDEIVNYLAPSIDRKVDLTSPDKIVWIDVIGLNTAVSVLRPDDIFSSILEH